MKKSLPQIAAGFLFGLGRSRGRKAAGLRSAVTHISQKSVPKSRFLTASPSREKPLVGIGTLHDITNIVGYGTRLLHSGRSCQPPALRNRGLTDVGHRRRRQQYQLKNCTNLRRMEGVLNTPFFISSRKRHIHYVSNFICRQAYFIATAISLSRRENFTSYSPISFLTSPKALTAWSMSALERPAEIWVRMRSLPLGTTG